MALSQLPPLSGHLLHDYPLRSGSIEQIHFQDEGLDRMVGSQPAPTSVRTSLQDYPLWSADGKQVYSSEGIAEKIADIRVDKTVGM